MGLIYYLLRKIVLHGLFWLVILVFYTFFFGLEDARFETVITFSTFLLPVTLATVYAFVYFLIPKYLVPRKYMEFAFYTLATLVISSSFITYSSFYGAILSAPPTLKDEFPIKKSLLFINVAVYLVVALACAFSLLKLNYKAHAANETLKNEILASQLLLKKQELEYLKMQIHPHFLFNTLNTLYGFALKKSEETPELILKLSNLLDYILYQTQKTKVPLRQEIEHIQDYISLEKMRFNEQLNVNIICGEISEESEIAPMILLPFVENSFKHGKLSNGRIKVELWLKTEEKKVIFQLKNSRENDRRIINESLNTEQPSGIGLNNLKKRLDLIYKNSYNLDLKEGSDFYEVALTLNNP